MAIDRCQRKFIELALEVFPHYLAEVRQSLISPTPVDILCAEGRALTAAKRRFRPKGDIAGCYVLCDHTGPIYVGISRHLLGRIRQHGTGTSHNTASLAYKMARKRLDAGGSRDASMQDTAFFYEFEKAKEAIRAMQFGFVEIKNPLELYLFEAFCAMELDTHIWNTFVTH